MDLDDFLQLMEGQIRTNASEKNTDNLSAAALSFLFETFRVWDVDRDGFISADELKVLYIL